MFQGVPAFVSCILAAEPCTLRRNPESEFCIPLPYTSVKGTDPQGLNLSPLVVLLEGMHVCINRQAKQVLIKFSYFSFSTNDAPAPQA